MATILQTYLFKHIFLNSSNHVSIKNSLNFIPVGPIQNKSKLVLVSNKHEAIIWANVDQDIQHNIASLEHNELILYLPHSSEEPYILCILFISLINMATAELVEILNKRRKKHDKWTLSTTW